jgi:ABC-2 type transport system permease protein
MLNTVYAIAFYTLLRRELVRIIRIWTQTLLPPVITMSLYYIIFGSIIGPRVGDMEGVSYLEYIVPGLVMMAIINSSYANVSSSFFSAKFQRCIEEMLVAPMSATIILLGYITAGVIRGLLVGVLVTLVSLFFIDLVIHSWVETLLIAALTATLFAVAGFINGIYAQKFDDVAFIPMFVLTPLTYFGGVFYSVDLLPPFWRVVTYCNPIYYMMCGFRYGMTGVAELSIMHTLIVLIGCTVLAYSFAWWLLFKGVGIKS